MNQAHQTVKERYLLNLWNDYVHSDRLHQLDRFLAQALRQLKSAGKKDRLWYGDHLFAMSRFSWLALFLESLPRDQKASAEILQAHIDTWCPPQTAEQAQRALTHLSPTALWQWTKHRLNYSHSGFENTPPRWLILLEALATSGTSLKAKLIWAGLSPQWQVDIEARAQHDHWTLEATQRFIDAHTTRPPLYVRPMPDRTAEVETDLHQHGLQTQAINNALAVNGSKGLYELDSYKAGYFEIQDLASQAIGERVEAKPGDIGWDACAGGGGKSLQLASLMHGKGAVYASDIRAHKLDEIRRRAQRAQLHNIRTFAWQGDPLDRLPNTAQKRGGFDWVLVDAPCTSSGTWRRNPDARWRCDNQQLQEITALQRRLLTSAAASVRPGGKLIYSTCSFFLQENENIIADFLNQHPDFQLITQGLHGNPHQDADTMFSAQLTRKEPMQ